MKPMEPMEPMEPLKPLKPLKNAHQTSCKTRLSAFTRIGK
ncbi:MAG: hypothetical protein NTW29_18720 [Bacteroidetes bacterium]|nr:hypothetical protein [Bacteroidota bacterium]